MLSRGKSAWAITCVCCVAFGVFANADDHLTVKTDKGKIHGKLSDDSQVRIFLGVPYAAPPVGPLRWKPPQPAVKWAGAKETMQFGSRCMQTSPFPDMLFRDPGQSEDCLNLNVWTPGKGQQGEAAGDGVDLWRRVYVGGDIGAAAGRPAPGDKRCDRRIDELSAGSVWIPGLAGFGGGVAAARRGELRPDGSDRGAAVGEAQHWGVWRRPEQRDDLRRVGGIVFGERADGVAAGAGAVRACDWRKRRGVSGPAGSWLQATGRCGEGGSRVGSRRRLGRMT